MRLFDDFSVVKCIEKDLLLVINSSSIYYIFNKKNNYWSKYNNDGYVYISVDKYDDVSKEELMDAMNGKFPTKETDFIRLCNPNTLSYRNMMDLLDEDYKIYMVNEKIKNTVSRFFHKSNILYKSYLYVLDCFKKAIDNESKINILLNDLIKLSYRVIGRDIFSDEIEIIDGHDSSSYFWIMPVRVIDYSDTDEIDNVAEFCSLEISIEESDVYNYLSYFLFKHFDNELKANKRRAYQEWIDDNNELQIDYIEEFDWYLTYNFYTFDSIKNIINDIKDTIVSLESGDTNDFISSFKEIREKEKQRMINFYNRFIYRLEYMMKIGQENGYDLISFMGP